MKLRSTREAQRSARTGGGWCAAVAAVGAFSALTGCSSGSSGAGAGAGSGSDAGGHPSGSSSGGTSTADAGADPYASCTWDLGSGTPMGTAPTGDNSADLGGATVGTAAFDASSLRRTVPVTVATPLAGITVGQAYLLRTTATDETAYLVLSVKNTGTGYPCFLQAKTYRWLDANDQILNTTNGPYLTGSVGSVSSTIDTDTCLAAGETGYLIEIELASNGAALYSAVTSIDIGFESTAPGTVPAQKLVPSRYDVGTCAAGRTTRIQAPASGAELALGTSLSAETLAPLVYLDDGGLPVAWAFARQPQSTNLEPGSTANVYVGSAGAPAVARFQAFLPFSPPDSSFVTTQDAVVSHALQAVQASRADLTKRWRAAPRDDGPSSETTLRTGPIAP
jgi:hypothetical protein